ncbi:MAG: hypothetical protein H7326_08035 [Bdellovibrionaceae bacterium]|nr:hypothetical protein [Pseudobdellovibrionaceae bacterium]
MFIATLLFSFGAWACEPGPLAPMVLSPTKNHVLEISKFQEVILDGGTTLPKITGIQGKGPKGKPMLSVMSGLQVLEKGTMKSYPHRISFKMNDAEADWERPVEVKYSYGGKDFLMNLAWSKSKTECADGKTK